MSNPTTGPRADLGACLLFLLLAGPAPAQEAPWVEATDGEGRFACTHPETWAVEPWERSGRRGLRVRPPAGDPCQGALFGIEYYTDPEVAGRLSIESLARMFHDHYAKQEAVFVGKPDPVEVDGAAGLAQRFVVKVVKQHEGKDVEFHLEYRVICVEKGGVPYVINVGGETRILEANPETCERLLAGVRLTP